MELILSETSLECEPGQTEEVRETSGQAHGMGVVTPGCDHQLETWDSMVGGGGSRGSGSQTRVGRPHGQQGAAGTRDC